MTISNKLSYLNDTKTLLRESINQAGGSITEETPFREYPSWVNYVVWLNSGGLETLFSEGEEGVLWGDLPYFVDVDGNTPATWDDPVGRINDSSGNGFDFTQPTVTARPILRNDPPRLEFDLTDDNLTTTLPVIENGTLVIAGTNGIWIDDDYNFDGGSFDIGPETYSGGPAGLLGVIGNPLVGGAFVIGRQLTTAERAQVFVYMQSIGSSGLIYPGPDWWEFPEWVTWAKLFDVTMNKHWPEGQ